MKFKRKGSAIAVRLSATDQKQLEQAADLLECLAALPCAEREVAQIALDGINDVLGNLAENRQKPETE
ncbi:MAG: hypothetical protein WCY09_08495 [Candidatus Omnitrophota bacterium]